MAFSAFLQLDGIKGEATESNHKDWIAISAYSHSLSIPAGFGGASKGGGRQAGEVTSSELNFHKALDKSSPALAAHCCSGKEIAKAVLDLVLSGDKGVTYMKYTFENCIIASVMPSGGGGEDRPTEAIGLRFGIMKWEYVPYEKGQPKPSEKAGWDFEKSKTA